MVLGGMAGPTDQESGAIKKIVCYTHRSREKGTHGGTPREAPGLVSRQGELGGNWGRNLYCSLHGKEQMRQCKKA